MPGSPSISRSERRIDQVRHVGRRDDAVRRRVELLAPRQRAAPRAAAKLWSSHGPKKALVRMTSAVGNTASTRAPLPPCSRPYTLSGLRRVVLRRTDARAAPSKTRSEEKVTNGIPRRRHAAASVTAPATFALPAGVRLRLGIVDAHVAGGVDHGPWPHAAEDRVDARRVADVEIVAAGEIRPAVPRSRTDARKARPRVPVAPVTRIRRPPMIGGAAASVR